MRHFAYVLFALLVVAPPAAHAGMLPDLTLTKTADRESALVGEEITFTIVVTNSGMVGATGVVMTDRIPGALDRVSVMTDTGTCMDAEPITCDLGDLAAGTSATITIVTRAAETGRVTNMAGVVASGPDATPSDNHNSDFVDISPGLPDAGPMMPDAGSMMMMMEEDEGGCGCVIPGGGRAEGGSVPTIPAALALVTALTCLVRRVSRFRRGGHRHEGWRRDE